MAAEQYVSVGVNVDTLLVILVQLGLGKYKELFAKVYGYIEEQ